jgi:hypothetical protein
VCALADGCLGVNERLGACRAWQAPPKRLQPRPPPPREQRTSVWSLQRGQRPCKRAPPQREFTTAYGDGQSRTCDWSARTGTIARSKLVVAQANAEQHCSSRVGTQDHSSGLAVRGIREAASMRACLKSTPCARSEGVRERTWKSRCEMRRSRPTPKSLKSGPR